MSCFLSQVFFCTGDLHQMEWSSISYKYQKLVPYSWATFCLISEIWARVAPMKLIWNLLFFIKWCRHHWKVAAYAWVKSEILLLAENVGCSQVTCLRHLMRALGLLIFFAVVYNAGFSWVRLCLCIGGFEKKKLIAFILCCTVWMKTTQQDLKSMNLSLNEAIDLAQNRPVWRLMSTFGATHSKWCIPEMNEWINECVLEVRQSSTFRICCRKDRKNCPNPFSCGFWESAVTKNHSIMVYPKLSTDISSNTYHYLYMQSLLIVCLSVYCIC